MNNKTSLRLKAKEIRNNLDINRISDLIVKNIAHSDIFKDSKNIMIFYPLKTEINVLKLLDYENKNFFLPRMNGKNLECCPYKKGDSLNTAKYNIKEPKTECILCPKLDLIIVPALAVDKYGNRLGYGGGFYDKFLKTIQALKLVPISQDLVFESVPAEEFDVKIDCFVTEKKVCNIMWEKGEKHE